MSEDGDAPDQPKMQDGRIALIRCWRMSAANTGLILLHYVCLV